MQRKKQENKLRDLIVNNPRAQERIDIKKIDEQVRKIDKEFESKNKSYSLLF